MILVTFLINIMSRRIQFFGKVSVLIVCCIVYFNLPLRIFAEEVSSLTPTTHEKQTLREKIQEKINSFREKTEERVDNKLNFRDQRAALHADRLQVHFDSYYERITRIIEKVQKRLDVMKNNKKDVSGAQVKLDEAKLKLEEAKKLGDDAISIFNAIKPENYEEQRSEALRARDMAQEARKAFEAVLKLVKDSIKLAKVIN
jgi:hypothetical protein